MPYSLTFFKHRCKIIIIAIIAASAIIHMCGCVHRASNEEKSAISSRDLCHLKSLSMANILMTHIFADKQSTKLYRGMTGWMHDWMDGCMTGWMNGCMDGWMDAWLDAWLDGWMNGCMAGWING